LGNSEICSYTRDLKALVSYDLKSDALNVS